MSEIQPINIETEVKTSYLDYAMSVIVSRALPDLRDGLKPVQRRILYGMWRLGLKPGAKFAKSARIVGSILGYYHPHGDAPVYEALTRMAQDFSLRYPLIIGQGNFGCFTKDTKVKLADGRNVNFEELVAEDIEGKKNYTYTVNALGNIAIAEIRRPRLTIRNAKLVRVTLDNGEQIRSTPNHKFMLRSGEYCEARNLKQGDSLMPLYERLSEKTDRLNRAGYVLINQNRTGDWVPAHHLADNFNLTLGAYKKDSGRVRHHVDFNKLNNSPKNVRRLHWGEHWKIHYTHAASQHENSEYREKIAQGRRKFWANSGNRTKQAERISERNRENWQNNEYREKKIEQLSEVNKKYVADHPEIREILSARMTSTLKRLWQGSTYRASMHEHIIKGNKNHTTNSTGKKKFLAICHASLKEHGILNEQNYSHCRLIVYPYGAAPTWNTGIGKYFQNNSELALLELNGNHKVVSVERLSECEDVYDLTIEGTHNFCLAAGIFVHNSIDGDSAAQMRYCLTGDTLAVTEKGLVPIKDIAGDKDRDIEDIDMSILSRDRTINKAVKWFNSGEHPTIKITTKRGFALQGSYNHPILIWERNIITGMPEFKWKLFDQLRTGDVAVIDRTADLLWPAKAVSLASYFPKSIKPRVEKKILPRELSENIAYILGALTAEGTMKKNEIEFCNSDPEWIQDFEAKWSSVFPDCRLHKFTKKPSSFGKKQYYTLEIHSQYVLEFLRNIGLLAVKSGGRTMPNLIFRSPKSVAAAFLRSYFEGDGSISSSGESFKELSCISKSEAFIKQIHILLLRFGIAAAKRFDSYRGTHKVYLRGVHNHLLFKEQIGFVSSRKNEKLEQVINLSRKDFSATDSIPFLQDFARAHINTDVSWNKKEFLLKHNFDRYPTLTRNHALAAVAVKPMVQEHIERLFARLLSTNYLFDPIVNIEDGGMQRVYSLKVGSPCHSFVANGFINHNTEAKLASVAEELLEDIDKETVTWKETFDGTRKEPEFLPAKLPHFLLNGAQGIAVGMATNIPPHNLSEVVGALIHLLSHPKASVEELLEFVKGPDFPTGGIIFDAEAIKAVYTTGRGAIPMRGKVEIKEEKKGRFLVVSEIPYQVNKADLITEMAELVRDGKIEGIQDIIDGSRKGAVNIVIELKKSADPQKVLNQLYHRTRLQRNFNVLMIGLVDGIEPRLLALPDILYAYIAHRELVITRRTEFELREARSRAHILEGLALALAHIDEVIALIKKSSNREEAKTGLVQTFTLSELQAEAILQMRLQTLAALERQAILDELEVKRSLIKELEGILASPVKIRGIIKKELTESVKRFGGERKTEVETRPLSGFHAQDLIPQEQTLIILTEKGYIKRVSPKIFQSQSRGGVGVNGIALQEGDAVARTLSAWTHDDLLFFSRDGKLFSIKAYEVSEKTRTAKGDGLYEFFQSSSPICEVSVLPSDLLKNETMRKKYFLVAMSKKGLIKKVSLDAFPRISKKGIKIMNLAGGDECLTAFIASNESQLIAVTAGGKALRFSLKEIRPMGRQAAGVRGMRVGEKDELVQLVEAFSGKDAIILISKKGYGKKSAASGFSLHHRGGGGMKAFGVGAKTGKLVIARRVDGVESDKMAINTVQGKTLILEHKNVPLLGRAARGVRLIRLKEGDEVASAFLL